MMFEADFSSLKCTKTVVEFEKMEEIERIIILLIFILFDSLKENDKYDKFLFVKLILLILREASN
jgi:hypothetical protein